MRKFFVLVVTFFLTLASAGLGQDRVAQLNKVQGRVTVARASSGKVVAARQLGPRVRNGSVFARDVVTTAAAAEAAMVFSDGTLIDLGENTSLAVDAEDLSALAKTDKPESRNIRVLAGDRLANVVPNPRVATRFETPSGVAAVKGTVLKIRSVRSHDDGGDAGIEIKEGEVDFHFTNGGTASLTTGTEIYAAFSRRTGLRVRVLFSNEPLEIRLGSFTVAMPRAAQADQVVEAIIVVDDVSGTFTVENTSTDSAGRITITDPGGNQATLEAGQTSDDLLNEPTEDTSSRGEVGEGDSEEGDAGEEQDKPKKADESDANKPQEESAEKDARRQQGAAFDPCMGIICECGTCSNGTCVGTAGCPPGRFCENGLCLDPCNGVFCQCGTCQNGTCVGTNPGCPIGNACQSGVCVPVQSPTDG